MDIFGEEELVSATPEFMPVTKRKRQAPAFNLEEIAGMMRAEQSPATGPDKPKGA